MTLLGHANKHSLLRCSCWKCVPAHTASNSYQFRSEYNSTKAIMHLCCALHTQEIKHLGQHRQHPSNMHCIILSTSRAATEMISSHQCGQSTTHLTAVQLLLQRPKNLRTHPQEVNKHAQPEESTDATGVGHSDQRLDVNADAPRYLCGAN